MSDATCAVEDCDNPRLARDVCRLHYQRLRRVGRLDLPRPRGHVPGQGRTSTKVRYLVCEWEPCSRLVALPARKRGRFCSRSCATQWTTAGLTEEQRAARNAQFQRDRRPKAEKKCGLCGLSFFPGSNHQRWCSTCIPDKSARSRYVATGFTHPQWQEALARFDGLCWVCRREPATDADHCHSTSRRRGALCSRCNIRLGYFEDAEWAEMARRYLQETLI